VANDVEAVLTGEHEVEDDCVVLARGGEAEAGLPVVGDVNGVGSLAQALLDEGGDAWLILDHQNAHFVDPNSAREIWRAVHGAPVAAGSRFYRGFPDTIS